MKTTVLLSAEELAAFSAQLSLTVKTGIPLSEAIMILRDDAETPAAKKLLDTIQNKLEAGGTLADALRNSESFPVYMTQMVEIGETSGRLESVLDSLKRYYEREDNISKSAKSAATYPAIMLIILIVIIVVLVTKILPIFQEVFNALGGEMTPLALGAMRAGQIISNSSMMIVIIIAAIVLAFIIMWLTQAGRAAISAIGRKVFGRLSDKIASAKFASAMSLMLASGVDIHRATELTEPLTENPNMRQKITKVCEMMAEGIAFPEAVSKADIFNRMQARLLLLGFKSGNIDNVMEQIADGAENDVDNRLDKLISIIEPTMVAILCVIVGLILLSAMLPLLGVMSSIM